jgi:hypothetical protein
MAAMVSHHTGVALISALQGLSASQTALAMTTGACDGAALAGLLVEGRNGIISHRLGSDDRKDHRTFHFPLLFSLKGCSFFRLSLVFIQ